MSLLTWSFLSKGNGLKENLGYLVQDVQGNLQETKMDILQKRIVSNINMWLAQIRYLNKTPIKWMNTWASKTVDTALTAVLGLRGGKNWVKLWTSPVGFFYNSRHIQVPASSCVSGDNHPEHACLSGDFNSWVWKSSKVKIFIGCDANTKHLYPKWKTRRSIETQCERREPF